MSNPWALTPRQCILMDAICIHGNTRHAALDIGMSPETAKGHMKCIRAAMRERSLVKLCLNWSAYRRTCPPSLRSVA